VQVSTAPRIGPFAALGLAPPLARAAGFGPRAGVAVPIRLVGIALRLTWHRLPRMARA